MKRDNAPRSTVPLTASDIERFWSFTGPQNGCWEWSGPKRKCYARIKCAGAPRGAHRISYQIHFGPIPDGLYVLHKCDNKGCVNPDHLEAGTQQKNVQDAVDRGLRKFSKGGHCGWSAKLTAAQVREIRRKYEKGRGAALAREYGVSRWCVNDLVRGKSWAHLKEEAA